MKRLLDKRRSRRLHFISLGIVFFVFIYVALCIFLPLPAIRANVGSVTLRLKAPPAQLPWPNYGEAAVGMVGAGLTQTYGTQTPLPTASVAKLITALAVLTKYPLSLGQQGPFITLDATDYGYYSSYIAEQGSVVPVYSGEQLSEYQMLQAMLVPSGNNIADSLARWAFGSIGNYDTYANSFVHKLGMTHTSVGGDASGFSPLTTSTASDLIILGSKVMANPLLSQIVGSKSVFVPNVGTLNNYDNILGSDGIIGIKTGNSNQDGGVFLSASKTTINTRTVTLVTAIMGAPSLKNALNDSLPLISALQNSFTKSVLLSQNEILGEFRQPWGGRIQFAAYSNLSLLTLPGQTLNVTFNVRSLKVPARRGAVVGSIRVPTDQLNTAFALPIVTMQASSKPTIAWRLLHPGSIF